MALGASNSSNKSIPVFKSPFKLQKNVIKNKNPSHWIARSFSTSEIVNNSRDVEIEVKGGIRTLRMNRPTKLNALNTPMFQLLAESLYESNSDDKTKIVVLTGTGDRAFTSGYCIKEIMDHYKNKVSQPDPKGSSAFIKALIDSQKPIIALVNGITVGIGTTLLALCETVYATEKATFNTPFMKVGIPPECGSTYLFPKIMGYAKAGEMLHFSETWSAREACANGLVTRVFPDEEFQNAAWERVYKMAEYPLQSLVHLKGLIRDKERELLHKIIIDESSNFDLQVVGPKVEKLFMKK